MTEVEIFDKDGKRIYLYSLCDFECADVLASYQLISEKEIQDEISEANKLYEEHNKEYWDVLDKYHISGKNLSPEQESEQEAELQKIDNKYSNDLMYATDRVIKKFGMFKLKSEFSVLTIGNWEEGPPPEEQPNEQ